MQSLNPSSVNVGSVSDINLEMPKLDEKTKRNLHILISAQADTSIKTPLSLKLLGHNPASKIPKRFDADKDGNLIRIGATRNFFIKIGDFFSKDKISNAMNDRARAAIATTLNNVDTHVNKLTEYAEKVKNSTNDDKKSQLTDIVRTALSIFPKHRSITVPDGPEDISSLDLDKVVDNLPELQTVTTIIHSEGHTLLPDNYLETQKEIIGKIASLKQVTGFQLTSSEENAAYKYNILHNKKIII